MKKIIVAIVAFLLVGASAFAQGGKYGATPEDSLECITNLSLYIEFYKQKNYKDAMNGWRKAVNICPKSRKSLYINGGKMYKSFIKEEQDGAKKELLIDTLLTLFDKRIESFGEEGMVLGQKGGAMMKYRKADPMAAYEVLKKAHELQGNDLEAGAVVYYYQAAYKSYKKKLLEKEVLFDLFQQLSDVVDYNMINGDEKSKKRYTTAQANLEKMFGSIATCPDLVEIYQPKFEATPTDTVLLKAILKIFDKRDCGEEELYVNAAIELHKIKPTCTSAYAIAQGKAKKKDYSGALEFYKNVEELGCDDVLKEKALMQASSCYLALKQYQSSASYARKVLAINPNNGEAYLNIGDAYGGYSSKCADTECTKRAGYWAAVDVYAKAKSIDASVAAKANKKIGAAKAQFPEKEKCFFEGINAGTSFTLPCWIGVTTTVRVRD